MDENEDGSSSGQLHHLKQFRKKASNKQCASCTASHHHSTFSDEQETE